MNDSKKSQRQPEVLAQFGKSARDTTDGLERPGFVADSETSPIPTDPKLKQTAATKVLREGVFKKDEGAQEDIDRLPDRIVKNDR